VHCRDGVSHSPATRYPAPHAAVRNGRSGDIAREKAGYWSRSCRDFEQLSYLVKDTPPEELHQLAAKFGCEILGRPVV
jgi:hypothetical protein